MCARRIEAHACPLSREDLPDQFVRRAQESMREPVVRSGGPAGVMTSQSGRDAQHKSGKATGLIQSMPKTLQGLG